jgi:hypothetical protein
VTVVLLLFVITISLAVIRVAAIILELTGVPWDRAKFHALSAFTNTGYPTPESEEIVRHPVRRRIIATLIVLGNAGFITTIATLAGSVVQSELHVSLRNIGLIALGVAALVWLSHRPWIGGPLRRRITRALWPRYAGQLEPPEELLRLLDGYTLTRVVLGDASPAIGRCLGELGLKQRSVQVLAIERGSDFRAVPVGEDRLAAGDRLVVYGSATSIREIFGAGEEQRFALVSEPFDAGA